MINQNDPEEWLKQTRVTPASAPGIVRLLIERLKSLTEENEELRNKAIELRLRIDSKSYQKEIEELRRRIDTFARIVKERTSKDTLNEALIIWTNDGHLLSVDLRTILSEKSISIPSLRGMKVERLHLFSVPLSEDLLFLTNKNQSGIFRVKELVEVSQEGKQWHTIPNLILKENEIITGLISIGKFPLCNSLITSSLGGSVRCLIKWTVDKFLISGNFGSGVINEKDVQTLAQLVYGDSADMILFTKKGKYLRIPISQIPPNPTSGIKMDYYDEIIGMVPDDRSETQVAIIGSSGNGIRRYIKGFQKGSIGSRPKPVLVSENLVGVSLVDDKSTIVAISGNDNPVIVAFEARQIPLLDRSNSLEKITNYEGGVITFASINR